ncbi:MAG TPA: sulfur carrier protein ThiS [Candidatus Goldiibacteriota bacterium]|nr:sulfur carrier protein ThiS [Candidatus Goldiibacteriota bacterium]HPI03249.1 sulfur carrier protein ThiS [Candidatus Goldiibacteriota bacterium]HPN64234.1 sulfur carrier protein ThiS [Candidatus Goldiibacteriota bacterium]HRQ42798.1 sulfur carrier protein ThiS [Candidatus Goldiibacteriota bacterium]
MKAVINGNEKEIETGMTVSALLVSLGLKKGMTVVELNGEIIGKDDFDSRSINHGDKVEIVRFVGGG